MGDGGVMLLGNLLLSGYMYYGPDTGSRAPDSSLGVLNVLLPIFSRHRQLALDRF